MVHKDCIDEMTTVFVFFPIFIKNRLMEDSENGLDTQNVPNHVAVEFKVAQENVTIQFH